MLLKQQTITNLNAGHGYEYKRTMISYKRITSLLAVGVIIALASFASSAQQLTKQRGSVLEQIEKSTLFNDKDAALVSDLLDYASTFKGTRYRRGSSSPTGFDCSGFTSYVFAKFGYDLCRSSRQQINDGQNVDKEDLKPGDLVFFNGRSRGSRIGHVGIVTEVKDNGKFEFIHASSTGVRISESEEPYYKARYVGACRVVAENKRANSNK